MDKMVVARAQGGVVMRARSSRLYRFTHWPFLLPAMFFITVFVFVPAIYVIYLSLLNWNLLSSTPKFVGLKNYAFLFHDTYFLTALRNSGLVSASMVVVALPLGLGLALLADMGLKGTRVYRTIIFTPYVIPLVASGLIWSLLFGDSGLINHLLGLFGISGPKWLGTQPYALISIMVVTIWQFTGYYMLIFLGGLQGVPMVLKEAARVDGAGNWGVFKTVTLPSLTPSLFFAVVVCIIQSLQTFDQVYIMTKGGPDGSTTTLVYYIFQQGFGMYNIGPATAASVILLLILGFLTFIQLRVSQRWVVEE
ncbi:sugar ABC transporter permease [Pullulanibacillus sp. KACC 23026]|uniref:carbohydrate ABC transporter permease n=1 Tax=Pullulanibacillus sp. KACC 23026 TaxID=3028315 RepID=UPI0023B08FEC|nr:sugar ABC transporter permease [Pullulanibacillus sp. KACC 23026]WEG13508.1 sugar ABC transporter permease [Pullulanibacillus sp. KACC 23026]